MTVQKIKKRGLEGGLDKLLGMGEYAHGKNNKNKLKRGYKKRSLQDKNLALTYLLIDNMSIKQVSDKLEINSTTLYKWKTEKERNILETSKVSRTKLDCLLIENKRLNEEKNILLKANSILSNSLRF